MTELIDPNFWRKVWNGEKVSLFGDESEEGEETVIEVIEEEVE